MLVQFLLSLLYICTLGKGQECPSHPDKHLTCYSDFNKTITCAWNSPNKHDSNCSLIARNNGRRSKLNSSCKLKHVSRSSRKECSMVFTGGNEKFSPSSNLTIRLECKPGEKNPVTSIFFKPYCLVKLNTPQKPEMNATTLTLSLAEARKKIQKFSFHAQWKQKDKPWTSDFEQKKNSCERNCTVMWNPLGLFKRGKYEARVRVMAYFGGSWSEWSPIGSWESHIEEEKTPLGDSGIISSMVICSVVVVLLLTVITLKRNQTIWIFLITKIKGQSIPNPALSSLKDVNFQNYLSPQLRTFFKPLEIASIEIASCVDDISPIKPEEELSKKIRSESSYESSNSSFSNPSYAHVCSAPPPPVSLLTFAGNLDPCAPDTPYGPVCCQNQDKDVGQKMEEVREKEVKIRELFSKKCNEGRPVLVISDYEKVEKLQMERSRLQSLDSGVGSGEEVSQESLEADSINMTESHEENQEESELEKEKGIFPRLFGGSVDSFGKGSIQVCSDYEQVQKLQLDSPELQSLNVNNEIQEQFGLEESLEDTNKSSESTNLLAPPYTFSSDTAMSSNVTGLTLRPGLHNNILALMSSSRSMELSSDGYKPVRQEQS